MKKIFLVLLVTIILLTGCNREKKVYDKIEESMKNALDEKVLASNMSSSMKITANSLISGGYLSKEDMKDVDGISYCDAYANVSFINDKANYDIFIKCMDYTTEGY